MRDKKSIKGDVILILSAIIYGSGLVAQKSGNDLGPFAFTAIRFLLGGVVLLPIAIFSYRWKSEEDRGMKPREMLKSIIIIAALLLFSVITQQYGLLYSTVGKAGFITSLYVIITPIVGVIFLKRKISNRIWAAALISILGFYLISLNGGIEELNAGDGLLLLAAASMSFYLYAIEYFAPKADAFVFTSMLFIITALICFPFSFIVDTWSLTGIKENIWAILYAGFGTCAAGYTLQMIGQRYVESERATILLSTEALFSLFAGMIILSEMLSAKEYAGCALIFAAVIIAETKEKKRHYVNNPGEKNDEKN